MATVSTIRLSVDLLDCAFVDSLDPRFLYRDSPYEIALTVKNGEAGLSTGIKLYDEDGEYLDLAGTVTAADGTATITIDDEIDFDGAYTCLICVNGSKAAEFPLEVRAIGSPVPPTGTVLDWNVITSYTDTVTKGPVRPHSGTLEVKATNADGSISIGVKSGLYDPAGSAATVAGNLTAHIDDTTAAHAATAISNTPAGGIAATTVQAAINELDSEKLAVGGTAADVNPAGTSIAAALLAKANDNAVVKLTGVDFQTIDSGGTYTAIEVEGPGAYMILDKDGTLPNEAAVFQFRRGTDLDVWQTGLRPDNDINVDPDNNRATSVNAWIVRNGTIGNGRHPLWIDKVTNFVHAPLGFVSRFIRALTSAGLALQDSAGAEHALLTSTGLRIRPRIVSSSITAELDGVYHGTAAATYTDPTPAEGRGYLVRVVNGTQTVGGTAYAAEGTVIMREYHSGSWRNRVLFGGADAAGVRANIGAAALTPTVNAQTGTTYTFAATDAGGIVTATNGSAITHTIPPNSSVPMPVGTIINDVQLGAGVLTIEGGTGVAVNGVSEGAVSIGARYQGATCLKIATDTWIISGAIA
jgi:hypothetical protein